MQPGRSVYNTVNRTARKSRRSGVAFPAKPREGGRVATPGVPSRATLRDPRHAAAEGVRFWLAQRGAVPRVAGAGLVRMTVSRLVTRTVSARITVTVSTFVIVTVSTRA